MNKPKPATLKKLTEALKNNMIKQVLEKLEHIQFGSLEQFKESIGNNMKDLVNNYRTNRTV